MIHADVTTAIGCRIRLSDPDPALIPPGGTSLMLSLDMEQEGDGRHAEVLLDAHAAVLIHAALDHWVMRR